MCSSAAHYDDLHTLYCRVWGSHHHHGIWPQSGPKPGKRTAAAIEVATVELVNQLIAPLNLQPGDHLCDIGCGTAETARLLASRFNTSVAAIDPSSSQIQSADSLPHPQVTTHCADWLANPFAQGSFDSLYAIESLAHIADTSLFFQQIARTLKPGGTAAIASWTKSPDLSLIERLVLSSIETDGKLSYSTHEGILRAAHDSGLTPSRPPADISHLVSPTWTALFTRAITRTLTDPELRRFLIKRLFRKPLYLFTAPKTRFSYATGALKYHLIWLKKP